MKYMYLKTSIIFFNVQKKINTLMRHVTSKILFSSPQVKLNTSFFNKFIIFNFEVYKKHSK
jgi:hypothetical protein